MQSGVAPVEAFVVDQIDGVGAGAVEQDSFVVLVIVLLLHLLLEELVALPQSYVLDSLNLQTQFRPIMPCALVRAFSKHLLLF